MRRKASRGLAGSQETLLTAIQAYAKEVSKADIAVRPAVYPYFLWPIRTETAKPTRMSDPVAAWTPRLLKAAYNYQVASKDPGKMAHNAKYVIQLMYDSIKDLNTKLSKPVDMSKAVRNDVGHFDGTSMAFRDWDADCLVSGCVCEVPQC